MNEKFNPKMDIIRTFFIFITLNVFENAWMKCWDISTSSEVSNCDGVVLEICLDHKFQWPQEGLKCGSLAYKVGPSGLGNFVCNSVGNFVCKRSAVVIQTSLEHDTIAAWMNCFDYARALNIPDHLKSSSWGFWKCI